MKKIIPLFIMLATSCTHSNLTEKSTKLTRSAEYQEEINTLLAQDAKNKELERQILQDIKVAQDNQDSDAFKFYLQEYMRVERLDIPEWMKKEPNYVEGGLNIKY